MGVIRRLRLADHRRHELRQLAARSNQVVLFAAITGATTGVFVAGFEYLVVDVLFEGTHGMPLPVVAMLPALGLLVSLGARRWIGGGTSPATADEYLHAFHDSRVELGPRDAVARVVAATATLGSGAPMGLEGPSLYVGATFGSNLQRRFPRVFERADHRILLVAGAAAGVAAIFKAPATGAVFALEVPYQDDLARRMLLPALVASVSGYLAFAAILGTAPLFPIEQATAFELRDLIGAAVVGIVAGLGARTFARLLRTAKTIAGRPGRLAGVVNVVVAGSVLGALFALGRVLTGESLLVGSGYQVVAWAGDPAQSIPVLIAILCLRSFATAAAVAGGGAGGLFIPLVVGGALTGTIIGHVVDDGDLTLFLVIGVAAFLGAGYRVPLAAVMFVAETTGRPSFVVPGVIAAVTAELMMGNSSVTRYQRSTNLLATDAGSDADGDAETGPDESTG